MIKFKIKIHAKQRLAYIPKAIVDALGTKLEAIPNHQGIFVYPKGLNQEQILNSIKTIYENCKQEIELQKNKKKGRARS